MKTAVVSEYMPFDEATCKFDFSAKHHYVYDEDLSLLLLYSSWQKRPTQQIFLQDWQEGKEKYWKYSTHRKTVYREKKQSHFFRWDKTPRIKRIKGPALTEKQVVIWLQLEKR